MLATRYNRNGWDVGHGALGFQFVSADAAHAWVSAYYNAMTKRLDKLCDYPINPNIALVSYFMCAKTDEEARRRAEGPTFFQFALRFYGMSATRQRPRAGTVDLWKEFQLWNLPTRMSSRRLCVAD